MYGLESYRPNLCDYVGIVMFAVAIALICVITGYAYIFENTPSILI